MKVLAINGSPRANGNTFSVIEMVAEELKKENIEVEIVTIGNKRITGCVACGGCFKNKNERCVIASDVTNDIIQKMKEADGIIISSPVYYAGINGGMKSFLDRAFYVAGVNGGLFRHKVGVVVVADRRSGGVTTFTQLNNYLTYSEMLIPTSNYWNVAFGRVPEDVKNDEEGKQIMRVLGKNMAWLMKLKENAKDSVKAPEQESKIYMSFIR